ncbi:hypothetical protein SAMN05443244_3282 [Terriglobus roseus]|uniref:Uncharacterized protein n=1 Tax=Terriglobus roseus TaxID=392734 RepID=A0A1H4RYB4_9BACT|nr:hypothetical protein SAMN05443244_3282 [Terriglobus roseus]
MHATAHCNIAATRRGSCPILYCLEACAARNLQEEPTRATHVRQSGSYAFVRLATSAPSPHDVCLWDLCTKR